MKIDLAGRPHTLADPERGLSITVPLTEPPDELLLDAIEESPTITAYCKSVEADERALVLLLKKESGTDGLSTLLTAVSSLVDSTNGEREDAAKTERERLLDELADQREQAEAELLRWWQSRA